MKKRFLGIDVYAAAQARVAHVFDTYAKPYVAFSGGKDSTALLHIVMAEARKRQQRVGVLFIDWEAQYTLTITHVARCLEQYATLIDPYWVALPLRTTNACSNIEPEWVCWDPEKRDLWVRPPPACAIVDEKYFPFYQHAMTFEDFVPAFARWYGEGAIALVGTRAAESLDRRVMLVREKAGEHRWITQHSAYPLYDWSVEDVWTFFAKTNLSYNAIYDRMQRAGLSLRQMRICEPYGDEQRRGLWLYHLLEPETWGRVAARAAGANHAALYARERGNVLGSGRINKPDGHTWESFCKFLLVTLPPATGEHYRNKFSVWRRWYEKQGISIVEELPDDTLAAPRHDKPSWRRLCGVLLKNDYWCKSLCFAPTQTKHYEQYKKIVQKRRDAWAMRW